MHIGIQTWGSDGDIRPLIALGGGLRAAGHEVTVAVSSVDDTDYSSLCKTLDLQYIKISDYSDIDWVSIDKKSAKANAVRQLKMILEYGFYPYQEAMYQIATQLCQCSDVVIGHPFVYPLKMAAIKTKTPFMTATLFPMLVPTAYRPPGVFPNLAPSVLPNLGKMLNVFIWKIGTVILDVALKKDIQRFWLQKGLPPFKHVATEAWCSEKLNLIAVSPVLCEQLPDWGTRYRVCGYFHFPDTAEPWTMPSELRDFLDAGAPPVYMTFGSDMSTFKAENNMVLLVTAAQQAGCRALIQTIPELEDQYPINTRHKDNENIYFTGQTPYQKIFPHCVAVVHHGGIGTTHLVLQHGCPSVVVPFIEEQLFWGSELHRIGVASKPLSRKKATPEKLAQEIRLVLYSQAIRTRATEFGEKMRQEDGVARAVELVQNILIM